MLVWGTAASFAQSGLIEPSEDGLRLPAVVSETGDSSSDSLGSQEGSGEPLFTINFRDADILEVLEAYSNLLTVNVVPGEGVLNGEGKPWIFMTFLGVKNGKKHENAG